MPHSRHAVSLWSTLTRPTYAMTCTPRNCPKCTHTSVRAPQRTRQTKASSSPQSEELRAASTLYSTLRTYRKLGPGNKDEIVQKLCQAVSCVRTRGIGARGSLPMAMTVAAAIACNAGCGNSISVMMDRFGVTNRASVSQIADRIRTQAWLWEGGSPLCGADGIGDDRCTHTHTRRLRIRARVRFRVRVRVRARAGARARAWARVRVGVLHCTTHTHARPTHGYTGPRRPLRNWPLKRWILGSSRRLRHHQCPPQRRASYAGSGMDSSNPQHILHLYHPRQSSANRLSMTQMLPSQRRPAPCAHSHRFLTPTGETTLAQT